MKILNHYSAVAVFLGRVGAAIAYDYPDRAKHVAETAEVLGRYLGAPITLSFVSLDEPIPEIQLAPSVAFLAAGMMCAFEKSAVFPTGKAPYVWLSERMPEWLKEVASGAESEWVTKSLLADARVARLDSQETELYNALAAGLTAARKRLE